MLEPERPVLSGCYPDPSLCRVGDDYYLVTSTFEYFPGIPVFHSTDLRSWTAIGHVVDRIEQRPHGGVIGASLDSDGTLRGSRKHVFRVEDNTDIMASQPVETCSGEERRIGLAAFKFGQSRCHIAAKADNLHIGAKALDLRGTAWGAGANASAVGKVGDAGRPDQPVARVGAFEDRGQADRVGADGFDILHRMHRKIDFARKQLGVECLGPQRLAADFGERAVKDDVAFGRHCNNFDVGIGPAMRGDKRRFGHMRLRQGKRRGTSAEAIGRPRSVDCGRHRIAVLATAT